MSGYIEELRSKIGHDMVIMNFSCACVVNDDGEILLQKRGDDGNHGKWGLPGGAVEIGESLEEAVLREVKEETGLEVEITRFIGAYSKYFSTYSNGDKCQAVVCLFECRPMIGQLSIDGVETIDLRYFDKKDLPEIFNEQHADMIRDWADGLHEVYR